MSTSKPLGRGQALKAMLERHKKQRAAEEEAKSKEASDDVTTAVSDQVGSS